MTHDAPERSHLSIGEVLNLLQDDFPDVTISKIRFLESQGLLDPERTPSGYRKFYDGDIERLRWILRHQRDHFLPLKVMKDRLEEATAAGQVVPPDEPVVVIPSGPPSLFEEVTPAASATAASQDSTPKRPPPSRRREPEPTRARPAPAMPELPARPSINPLDGGATSASFTREELSAASGLSPDDLSNLAGFGLLTGRSVAGETFYDGDALVVALTAADFMRFGIEARHLRMYKVSAEREAGFMEQILMPLLKQRNPAAREQAAVNLGELAGLGDQMRSALLRIALRDYTEPR